MPGMRRPGMDNDYYDYSPISTRKPLAWPGGARVALCVIVALEHYEYRFVDGAFVPADVPGGGLGRRPFPDLAAYSHREYGNRVGLYRVLEVLDKYGIKATAAIDAAIAEHYPEVVAECKSRGYEFIGHGKALTQMITSNMTEDQERAYIKSALDTVEHATGSRPRGWWGAESGESTRTPAILAEEGINYVCDWPNDEQPYPMKVPKGAMYSLPTMIEFDDVYAHWNRHVPLERWARIVTEGFDVMYADGAAQPRLLAWTIHPWLIGQPFRIRHLDNILGHILGRAGIWQATGGEIIDWYAGNA